MQVPALRCSAGGGCSSRLSRCAGSRCHHMRHTLSLARRLLGVPAVHGWARGRAMHWVGVLHRSECDSFCLVMHAWGQSGLPNPEYWKSFIVGLLFKAHGVGLARVARPPRPSRAGPGRCCGRDRIHTNASQVRLTCVHGAAQGRSPTSAESGVAWTLLREEPPGGQAMDLPRGEWRTAILAGDAGALPYPNFNPKSNPNLVQDKLNKLREEPPGGQAMDLPRGEWRTAILAGDAGVLP